MAFELQDIYDLIISLEEELAEEKLDDDDIENLYFDLEELIERYKK